jgi:hypothetical protein
MRACVNVVHAGGRRCDLHPLQQDGRRALDTDGEEARLEASAAVVRKSRHVLLAQVRLRESTAESTERLRAHQRAAVHAKSCTMRHCERQRRGSAGRSLKRTAAAERRRGAKPSECGPAAQRAAARAAPSHRASAKVAVRAVAHRTVDRQTDLRTFGLTQPSSAINWQPLHTPSENVSCRALNACSDAAFRSTACYCACCACGPPGAHAASLAAPKCSLRPAACGWHTDEAAKPDRECVLVKA